MCFHLAVRLWTQLLKMGSRVFGRVCQARETDSPKPGFQALRHLVSSSQTFFLERPDLICSLAVNYVHIAIMKTVEMFIQGVSGVLNSCCGCHSAKHLGLCLTLSERTKSVPRKFMIKYFSAQGAGLENSLNAFVPEDGGGLWCCPSLASIYCHLVHDGISASCGMTHVATYN